MASTGTRRRCIDAEAKAIDSASAGRELVLRELAVRGLSPPARALKSLLRSPSTLAPEARARPRRRPLRHKHYTMIKFRTFNLSNALILILD